MWPLNIARSVKPSDKYGCFEALRCQVRVVNLSCMACCVSFSMIGSITGYMNIKNSSISCAANFALK